jgi:hypothetical protein
VAFWLIWNSFKDSTLLCITGVCPALCSGNGIYLLGACKCNRGWTGAECQLVTADCAGVDCSHHGRCIDGQCICAAGYTGLDCVDGQSINSNNLYRPCQ